MGGAGSAWVKSKASSARGLRGGEAPGHPVAVKAGQRYWPRQRSSKATRTTFAVVRFDPRSGRVTARREDAQRRAISMRSEHLLAPRADGQGAHYQFLGWLDRSYTTVLQVVEPGARTTRVCVPEWHQRRVFDFFTTLLPEDCRGAGAFVRCRARLASATAGALNLADLRAATVADRRGIPPAQLPGVGAAPWAAAGPDAAAGLVAGTGAAAGVAALRDAGDVVVRIAAAERAALLAGALPRGLYLTGPTPRRSPGATLFLAHDGWVTHAAPLRAVRPNPNGFHLEIDASAARELDDPVAFRERTAWPPQRWQRRWWPVPGQDAQHDGDHGIEPR